VSTEFAEPTHDELRALLSALVGKRVAVIGDAMLDGYLFGRVSRISPESPVPVVEVEREEHGLGGAANVAKCLVALGARVRLCATVGADAAGELLLQEARGLKVDVSGVLRDASRPTTVKQRVVAQRQQMLRLDRESRTTPDAKLERRLLAKVRAAVRWADAVILSDYAKGLLTPAICRAAIASAGKRPVVVDPKTAAWERFRGATVFKPNRHDVRVRTGRDVANDAEAGRAAREILRDLRLRHVLITRGEHGLTLASRNGHGSLWTLAARRHEVYDVTGAGDVVSATLALALAAGTGIRTAAWLANVAAGVKVTKFGAATVSDQEILDALGHGALDCERKVLTARQAAALAARLHRQGRAVVFTNGCFDILHYGHVSYLERSRRLGDALIVGVNTDASVRRLKGPGRPVQNELDRARILAAQACVDAVVLFDEDTPRQLIRAIRPQVLCKGGDYKRIQDVVGWDLVGKWGGRVALVPPVPGRSSSGILGQESSTDKGVAPRD
jgi:D-beta-D-heptose 7-phosphate kinase / D-beta-D-heptose 1-phosphate adenosyltransferase